MAFVPGYKSRLLTGDYALSGMCRDVGVTSETMMLDTTVMDATAPAKSFIPGLVTASLTASGPLDVDATSGLGFDQLATWKSGASLDPLTFAPQGLTAGNQVWIAAGYEASVTVNTTVAGTTDWALQSQVSGVYNDNAISLHDLTAETATGFGTEIDTGAGSTGGAIANLHVTAFSGFSQVVFTVATATSSGGSFSDRITFTTVTGTTSQRVAVTGTIDRYVKVSFTKTGTGSVTFAVGFARL